MSFCNSSWVDKSDYTNSCSSAASYSSAYATAAAAFFTAVSTLRFASFSAYETRAFAATALAHAHISALEVEEKEVFMVLVFTDVLSDIAWCSTSDASDVELILYTSACQYFDYIVAPPPDDRKSSFFVTVPYLGHFGHNQVQIVLEKKKQLEEECWWKLSPQEQGRDHGGRQQLSIRHPDIINEINHCIFIWPPLTIDHH